MSKDNVPTTEGCKANAAQPLGERSGLVSEKETCRTARQERRSAGPDGPDATVIGRTFKQGKRHPLRAG